MRPLSEQDPKLKGKIVHIRIKVTVAISVFYCINEKRSMGGRYHWRLPQSGKTRLFRQKDQKNFLKGFSRGIFELIELGPCISVDSRPTWKGFWEIRFLMCHFLKREWNWETGQGAGRRTRSLSWSTSRAHPSSLSLGRQRHSLPIFARRGYDGHQRDDLPRGGAHLPPAVQGHQEKRGQDHMHNVY